MYRTTLGRSSSTKDIEWHYTKLKDWLRSEAENNANFTASGIAIGCSTLQHRVGFDKNEHVNPLMHDFYFQGKTGSFLLLRISSDWNKTFEYWMAFIQIKFYSVPKMGRFALMG